MHASPSPIIKWAGGKRAIADQILQRIPRTVETYYEPFLGGAAVFLTEPYRFPRAHLSDINERLITTYTTVRDHCDEVIANLEACRQKPVNEDRYYSIRQEFNNTEDEVTIASTFLYLNKTCYNGLYRENSSGKFNVPYGHHENLAIDYENLREFAALLRNQRISLACHSYGDIAPSFEDVVYCDPPYHACFGNYSKNGFGEDEQLDLRDMCLKWRNSGATVLVSNADTTFVRDLYTSDFELHEIRAPRAISRNGSGRKNVRELLAVATP